mgnify:FL=1
MRNTEEMKKIAIYSIIIGTVCWASTVYVNPQQKTFVSKQETPVELPEHEIPKPEYQWAGANSGFEIRIQNETSNERLEVVKTLDDALLYLKTYSMYHDDLFVYDLNTGRMVADCYVVGGGEGQIAIE